MANHINAVLRQALVTFTCKSEQFSSNLGLLAQLLDKITANDVNLGPQFSEHAFWTQPHKAPVSCIDIFENSTVTMGIFVLKPEGQLPLHNHPEMHGLIKVIMGKVKITSYSLNTPKTLEIEKRTLKDETVPKVPRSKRNVVIAELISEEIVDCHSKPCVLEPEHKNLHKIQSVDGPAAFLDILAPPYMTNIPNNGPRLCSYYAPLSQVTPEVFRLHEIASPSWYWCDMCPYTGPDIHL